MLDIARAGLDFLQADDIGSALFHKAEKSFSQRGAQAIDVP
jgi:hypothetical protein